MATKKDIELLRAEMQTQNTELRAEMHAQNTELRADIKTLQRNFNTVRWMIGLLYPLTFGVLVALLF